MTALKLITLNMEGNRHLERILPFIERESADVLCLQEIFYSDFENIKSEFGYHGFFKPMYLKNRSDADKEELQGVAIFSRESFADADYFYYRGREEEVTFFKRGETTQHPCLKIRLVLRGHTYNIASTHFTWTPEGNSNPHQLRDLEKLLSWLGKEDLILCGDFNAPRADGTHDGLAHARLAKVYKDNIPLDIFSTLDGKLHRKSWLKVVVDYIWSTPEYQVENVRVQSSLSDHCAIVAEVFKDGS